ncbi:hypothetical protein RJ41_08065 [Alteromonas marina]|uniref:Lipoprotein n=1 Tax=Alteromonas marina TaxID=203795 RepID=A0A0B3XY65_9ALTE|nr:hypothetical protein [Alteromonas marina]KHT54456.1 hypothetical protein RJ41_08065 [Alteromonas marina]
MKTFKLPFFLLLMVSMLLPGCAVTYVDENGHKNIIGFVNVKTESIEERTLFADETVDVSALGLMFFNSSEQSFVAFGYGRETNTYLKNNVLLLNELDLKKKQCLTDERMEDE